MYGAGRQDRQHLRAPARPRPEPGPGHDRKPSRHPADRWQVRRRLRRDGGAGGRAHAQRCRLRDPGADRDRCLDQRGGLAFFAGDGRLGGVRRGVRWRGQTTLPASHSVPSSSASALPAPSRSAAGQSRPISRRISSKGRFSRRQACRSASSPAPKASAGTTSTPPARRRMPGRHRCRGDAMRWSVLPE